MNNQITPQQALNNLYQASRKAPLTADEHNLILECAKIIEKITSPDRPSTKIEKITSPDRPSTKEEEEEEKDVEEEEEKDVEEEEENIVEEN
jgi:hypothetical protein